MSCQKECLLIFHGDLLLWYDYCRHIYRSFKRSPMLAIGFGRWGVFISNKWYFPIPLITVSAFSQWFLKNSLAYNHFFPLTAKENGFWNLSLSISCFIVALNPISWFKCHGKDNLEKGSLFCRRIFQRRSQQTLSQLNSMFMGTTCYLYLGISNFSFFPSAATAVTLLGIRTPN